MAHAAPEPSAADLTSYQRGDGQTFFALSLKPPADAAADLPQDIIILFDTSASQRGVYRQTALAAVEACVAGLGPQDRVQLLAVDLEGRPLTDQFLAPGSDEMRAALAALRRETPLGSTDMEGVLQAAISRFDASRPTGRALLYVGDGVSNANLLGTETFRELIQMLNASRVAVSSYAIGPQCDGRLLAALANQSGGNLYVAAEPATADPENGINQERAEQENLRRGEEAGRMLATWAQVDVLWPQEVTWPANLGDVYPTSLPPLRSDRETVVLGATNQSLEAPLEVHVRASGRRGPMDLEWTAKPHPVDETHAFLAQLVEMARQDGGITLPIIGTAGLAETARLLSAEVDNLTDFAETAVAMGDLSAANVAAKQALLRDPSNVKAQLVDRVAQQMQVQATPVAQTTEVEVVEGISEDDEGDLTLVRRAQDDALEPPENITDQTVPAEGSLFDRFSEEGALLSTVEQQRRVFAEMLRQQVNVAIDDARRLMTTDPERVIQDLKLTQANVERAPELAASLRAQLIDKLRSGIREAERQATIKQERDAELAERLAMARERTLLEESMARDRERERQYIDRVDALVSEHQWAEAEDVAEMVEEIDPEGVTPRVAVLSTRMMRNHYLAQVTRADRWRYFVETMYLVEKSSVPFPDEPPIVYPPPEIWRDLSDRRKERWGAMDLKSSGEAERKIESALRNQLSPRGLEYDGEPLELVVDELQAQYQIPIQIDARALADEGLGPDELVTVNLHGISLRSALNNMLRQLNLTYIIQDEVLLITTQIAAEQQLVVKVYPVADLVIPIQSIGGIGGFGGGGFGGGGLGGFGGGLGGGGLGGFGGGGLGGFGGGGFGGGGFGGGGLGGFGGGGVFSVPEPTDTTDSPSDKALDQSKRTKAQKKSEAVRPASRIEIDVSVPPATFWDGYFASQSVDPAAVRETVRQEMGARRYEQVIELVHSALRHGQSQWWMYETLGIAMELAERPSSEIERAVMSAVDFSSSPDELMYIAQYLSRLGLASRAMKLYQQVTKLQPLRGEAYALGMRAAQRCDDLAGIEWATVGVLSQAWPSDQAEVERTALRVAKATLERLDQEGNQSQSEAFRAQLRDALVRDVVVRVSWTGDADIDVSVEEPAGTICSLSEPRSIAGGVALGDAFTGAEGVSDLETEVYVCPQGFAGPYRVRIHRVWGEVAAGKVTVDVVRHLRSNEVQHERQQIELGDEDAVVVFELDQGRRTEPLEAVQLAASVQRRQEASEAVSRSVLAQQISDGSDSSVLPVRPFDTSRRLAAAVLGRGGAVGFMPQIQVLPSGTFLITTGVVSADRRYVRISPSPSFMTVGDIRTFTFAGPGEVIEPDMGAMDGMDGMMEEMQQLNLGGGGFGGR